MAESIDVEVVYALPEEQFLVAVSLPAGATVADAVAASGIGQQAPHVDLETAPVGIWGRLASRDQRLKAGDRVEVYRSLELEPREARRQLAALGRTMREGRDPEGQSRGSSS